MIDVFLVMLQAIVNFCFILLFIERKSKNERQIKILQDTIEDLRK